MTRRNIPQVQPDADLFIHDRLKLTHSRPTRAALVVLLVLAAFPSAPQAVSQRVPIGARPIAMGGAFSSLVDDASALSWNPAGLMITAPQGALTLRSPADD